MGGGFEDFTNNTMQNMTGTAGMWTARVLAGTRRFFGVEAAYVGNARSIDALGLQSSASLIVNGVEGDAARERAGRHAAARSCWSRSASSGSAGSTIR